MNLDAEINDAEKQLDFLASQIQKTLGVISVLRHLKEQERARKDSVLNDATEP